MALGSSVNFNSNAYWQSVGNSIGVRVTRLFRLLFITNIESRFIRQILETGYKSLAGIIDAIKISINGHDKFHTGWRNNKNVFPNSFSSVVSR